MLQQQAEERFDDEAEPICDLCFCISGCVQRCLQGFSVNTKTGGASKLDQQDLIWESQSSSMAIYIDFRQCQDSRPWHLS